MVKGRQLEGVRKIFKLEDLHKHFDNLNCTELLVVDYTKSNFGLDPNYEAVTTIAKQFNLPITYGGGITSLEHIEKLARAGASRFYINSILSNEKFKYLLKDFCDEVGMQSIVVGIEYRIKNNVLIPYYNAGRDIFPRDFSEHLNHILDHDIGEVIFTCINNDGMKLGFDKNISPFLKEIKHIPKIVSGGGLSHDSSDGVDGTALSTFYIESSK